MRTHVIVFCASFVLAGCAGSKPEPARIYAAALPVEPEPGLLCTTRSVMIASGPGADVAGGRSGDKTDCRCQIAQAGVQIYLRDLLRSADTISAISNVAIRTTKEFKSYMDRSNRWQWKDRATEVEALYACRLMLADLHAGRRIRWNADARRYLMRARELLSRPSSVANTDPNPVGVTGTTPPKSDRPGVPTSTPNHRPYDPFSPRDFRPDGSPQPWPGTRVPPGPGRVPSAHPPTSPILPMSARPERSSSILDVLDTGWHWLTQLRRGGESTAANLLETLLENAEQQLAAATVFLAGTTITIVLAKGTAEFTVVIEGVKAADMALMVDIAEPLMLELGANLGKIQTLSNSAGLLPAIVQPALALKLEEHTYRALARQSARAMSQTQLEQLQTLRLKYEPNQILVSKTATHKAKRWANYQARSGTRTFEQWSKGYENSVRQYERGKATADRYHEAIGWGEREVPVYVKGKLRVLDIADVEELHGVEVKSGYVSHRRDIARQVLLDARLVKQRWTITWYVEGRFSDPLKKSLYEAGIKIIETNPLLRS